MNKDDTLLKKADIQKIAHDGAKIYAQIKDQYGPKEMGKFLAIDIGSKKSYLGKTSADALNVARKKHPNKIFYVLKIGVEAAETVAKQYLK